MFVFLATLFCCLVPPVSLFKRPATHRQQGPLSLANTKMCLPTYLPNGGGGGHTSCHLANRGPRRSFPRSTSSNAACLSASALLYLISWTLLQWTNKKRFRAGAQSSTLSDANTGQKVLVDFFSGVHFIVCLRVRSLTLLPRHKRLLTV
jgi:hypothetical protein